MVFFYDSSFILLAGAQETIRLCRTPVENHWCRRTINYL